MDEAKYVNHRNGPAELTTRLELPFSDTRMRSRLAGQVRSVGRFWVSRQLDNLSSHRGVTRTELNLMAMRWLQRGARNWAGRRFARRPQRSLALSILLDMNGQLCFSLYPRSALLAAVM
jgi:hypothetical protein